MHGQPSSGIRCLDVGPNVNFQVPTMYVQPAMALEKMHVSADSSKPLLLVYTHAVRQLLVP